MPIEGRRRERFLPYAHERGGLTLELLSCQLDGAHPVAPEAGAHLLSLEGRWQRADLRLEVRVPGEVVRRVLPAGVQDRCTTILLALRCDETRLRRGLRAEGPGPEGGAVRLSLELGRDELAGVAELHAFLVLAEELPRARGFAHERGARLATARAWTIAIDRRRLPEGRYLEIRYRHFAEDEVIPEHDRENLYLLEHDQPSPVLWINADHEAIVSVLDSKASVGRQARLREAVYDLIAAPVWTQLFWRAAHDVLRGGEAAYPWQERVLDELAAEIYPELPAVARRGRLEEELEDPAFLLSRLDAALQRRSRLTAHLERLIEEEVE